MKQILRQVDGVEEVPLDVLPHLWLHFQAILLRVLA